MIRADQQPPGEDDALRGFFDATRRGMLDTLLFQARQRGDDLLWNPVQTARDVQRVIDRVRPTEVVVDHLAFTARWNEALCRLDPGAAPIMDAFAEPGDVLFLNYPAAWHGANRTALLPPHAFLGSTVREEAVDDKVQDWLPADTGPIVYVSFGSFLSVRGDVLARVAAALRRLDVRVAIAAGSTSPEELGALPDSWLVRGFLPQVTLLRHAVLAVSHGGNNSVTESLASGVPLLLLPLSTDQFAGAAAVETAGLGVALDPNAASADDVRTAAAGLLSMPAEACGRLRSLSESLKAKPGPREAFEALAGR